MRRRRSFWLAGSLLAVASFAFFLRAWGGDYGLPHPVARPDEERVVGMAYKMVATGDWAPGSFSYPALFMYLNALVMTAYYWTGVLEGTFESLRDFLLTAVVFQPGLPYRICRTVAAGVGTATVLATYLLARQTSGRSAIGLLAAGTLATCHLHVRDTHFATVDGIMTLFVTLSLVFAIRAATETRSHHFALAGLCAGLAAASKYNGGLVLLGVFGAALSLLVSKPPEGRTSPKAALVRLALGCSCALIAFSAAAPYSVIHFTAVAEALQQQTLLLYRDGPWAMGLHLSQTFPQGLGWPVFLAGSLGLLNALRLRRPADRVLLAFYLPFLASIATVTWIFPRYVMPLVPIMVVFAAETGFTLLSHLTRAPVAAMLTASLMIGPGLWKSIQFDRLAARDDTRILMARWVAEHLPPRTELLLCRGYGAPAINRDRRRPPAYEVKEIDCSTRAVRVEDARYLITHEHPYLTSFSRVPRDLSSQLEQEATLRVRFDPFRRDHPGVEPFFYPADAFYLPLSGFSALVRGGPVLTLWELSGEGTRGVGAQASKSPFTPPR